MECIWNFDVTIIKQMGIMSVYINARKAKGKKEKRER